MVPGPESKFAGFRQIPPEYFDCEQTPLEPYWPDYGSPMEKGTQRNLSEIPVTVGFKRKNYRFMRSVYNTISHPSLYHLHLVAIFWHTHLLRKLYLCPEVTASDDMRLLVKSALANEQPVIHMYFHSSSLVDGATGFMEQENAYDVICSNIENIVEYIKSVANIRFCTISEASVLLKNRDLSL